MSRIGKRQLNIPEGVSITIANSVAVVKGPLGELSVPIHRAVKAVVTGKTVATELLTPGLNNQWGTANALINSALVGVSKGFVKELKVEGVGFKTQIKGTKLSLALGQTHPIEMAIPKGLKVETPTATEIKITGFDKQVVGQFAANIRVLKKPEPYNGKGVAYKGERIVRKVGKTAEGTKK